jgi:hypothetical protein
LTHAAHRIALAFASAAAALQLALTKEASRHSHTFAMVSAHVLNSLVKLQEAKPYLGRRVKDLDVF